VDKANEKDAREVTNGFIWMEGREKLFTYSSTLVSVSFEMVPIVRYIYIYYGASSETLFKLHLLVSSFGYRPIRRNDFRTRFSTSFRFTNTRRTPPIWRAASRFTVRLGDASTGNVRVLASGRAALAREIIHTRSFFIITTAPYESFP